MKISRKWHMPSRHTFTIKPIKELLNRQNTNFKNWADPFSGENSPAEYTNDLNPNKSTTHHMDALDFLKTFEENSLDGVLYDPPYSFTQACKCYSEYGKEKLKVGVNNMKYWSFLKKEIARIIKPKGIAICCGWNTNGVGVNLGFKMQEILIIAHGGNRNDTLVTVEIAENKQQKIILNEIIKEVIK